MKKMMLIFALFMMVSVWGVNAQDVVETQLFNIGYRLGQNGYTWVYEQYGNLDEGYKRSHRVYLTAGHYYQIASVCDEDCGDIDIKLYDGFGNLVVQDTAGDDTPVVTCTVYSTGNFTIDVIMESCDIEPCKYGVVVFGR